MFAIRHEYYLTDTVYYTNKCRDYASACQKKREIEADMDDYWTEGEDYQLCVVEVPDDFDFDNQNNEEWN